MARTFKSAEADALRSGVVEIARADAADAALSTAAYAAFRASTGNNTINRVPHSAGSLNFGVSTSDVMTLNAQERARTAAATLGDLSRDGYSGSPKKVAMARLAAVDAAQGDQPAAATTVTLSNGTVFSLDLVH